MITVEYVSDMMLTIINAVHQIQIKEKDALKDSNDASIEKAVAAARELKSKPWNYCCSYTDENNQLRQANHDKEIKFIGAFGMHMEVWDGPLDHAEKLIADVKQKQAAKKDPNSKPLGQPGGATGP